MALHLERHPAVHAAFNFVPSLLDQIEDAVAGKPDLLFDRLRMAPAELDADDRSWLVPRLRFAPRWARERMPVWQKLAARAGSGGAPVDDDELLMLEVGFLLAWLDPILGDEPAAVAAQDALQRSIVTIETRDALLALHRDVWSRVLPAYRRLAERGQVELSESAYNHPILPLICDIATLQRARPDLPLPGEPFAAPEDARWQIERARARHAQVFGSLPPGMWPSEGSVSPEAAAIAASCGVRWLASDEGVLWASLPESGRQRLNLYQPWVHPTPAGPMTLLFRDRELSDRVGFVYARWGAREAVEDFMTRLRHIASEWQADGRAGRPVVSVMLDGENCWENYAEDGGPFLTALYEALTAAPDVQTRTPSEVLEAATPATLEQLHSGSWIDADFHIWAGQPEKNRAWELLARARRALVESGATRDTHPTAWQSLSSAEGSDWFWWFGDDHHTPDKALFDMIFREHIQAIYERIARPVPGWVGVPITRVSTGPDVHRPPLALVSPTIDGRSTHFYEWQNAGSYHLVGGGGAMHHGGARRVSAFYYGFDRGSLYLRLDFPDRVLPGDDVDLVLTFLLPTGRRVAVRGIARGVRAVELLGDDAPAVPLPGASAVAEQLLEVGVPFRSLGLVVGDRVEMLVHLVRGSEHLESVPPDHVIRFAVPGPEFEQRHWSV